LADHATCALARNVPVNLEELVYVRTGTCQSTGEMSAHWREAIARAQLNLSEEVRARLPDNLQLRIAVRHAWRLNRDVWSTSNYLYAEAFRCLF
jgi:hypothetical protein